MPEKLYVPIDVTPKTGSNYDKTHGVKFERGADFLLVIDGADNSRLLVQERYDVLRAMYSHNVEGRDAYIDRPEASSPIFGPIRMILQMGNKIHDPNDNVRAETYETGKLTHGDGNPDHDGFNSLTDFRISGDEIEIRIAWQLLNFSNPAEQQVHDDYYEHYGVENLKVDSIYAGVGSESAQAFRIPMGEFKLKGWGRKPSYHERLKRSYYMIKDYWNGQ